MASRTLFIIVIVSVMLIAVIAAGEALQPSGQKLAAVRAAYIPKVVLTNQTKPQVSYNYVNIAKDSVIVAAAGVAMAGCTGVTFGVCATSVGAAAVGVSRITNDTILTDSANFIFSNVGNATATNWGFTIETKIDNTTVRADSFTLPAMPPNSYYTFSYTREYKFGEIPALLWNAITQHNERVTFTVTGLGSR